MSEHVQFEEDLENGDGTSSGRSTIFTQEEVKKEPISIRLLAKIGITGTKAYVVLWIIIVALVLTSIFFVFRAQQTDTYKSPLVLPQ